jgi:hypothetical protein
MTHENDRDNLIDDLYPEPIYQYRVPNRKPIVSGRSIHEIRAFGTARLRGYDSVVESFMDPDGKFHRLESYEQQVLAVRCGLIEGSSPVLIKDVALEFKISATRAQDIITIALARLGRK